MRCLNIFLNFPATCFKHTINKFSTYLQHIFTESEFNIFASFSQYLLNMLYTALRCRSPEYLFNHLAYPRSTQRLLPKFFSRSCKLHSSTGGKLYSANRLLLHSSFKYRFITRRDDVKNNLIKSKRYTTSTPAYFTGRFQLQRHICYYISPHTAIFEHTY